jgi:hypothetical protein
VARRVISDTDIVRVAAPRFLDRRQVDHQPVIPRAHDLHRPALAGGDLDPHKSCLLQFSYMHGDCAVRETERFCQIVHAEGIVLVYHFHDLHAHGCTQCLEDIFGFADRAKVQHQSSAPFLYFISFFEWY